MLGTSPGIRSAAGGRLSGCCPGGGGCQDAHRDKSAREPLPMRRSVVDAPCLPVLLTRASARAPHRAAPGSHLSTRRLMHGETRAALPTFGEVRAWALLHGRRRPSGRQSTSWTAGWRRSACLRMRPQRGAHPEAVHGPAFQCDERNKPLAGRRQVDGLVTAVNSESAKQVQRELSHVSIVKRPPLRACVVHYSFSCDSHGRAHHLAPAMR